MINFFSVIDPVAFRLGGIEVRWYGIIIAFAIYIAVTLADKEATKKGFRKDFVIDLVMWMIPIAFIGARLYYVLFNLDYYMQNIGEIIQIWRGGLAVYGGFITGALVIVYFCKKEKVSVALFLDVLIPVVLLAQGIGRWGNFFNQEAHGGEVTRQFLESLWLPNSIIDQMQINGMYYHPTFLYESIWCLIGVGVLVFVRKRCTLKVGELTLLGIMWYSLERFFVEGMRTDSLYLFDVIRISQLISLILLIGAIVVWIYRKKQYPNAPLYKDVHLNKA